MDVLICVRVWACTLTTLTGKCERRKNWAGEVCGRNEYVFLFCAGLWQVPSDEDICTGVSTSAQLSE